VKAVLVEAPFPQLSLVRAATVYTIIRSLAGFVIVICLWAIAASYSQPLFLPSPLVTLKAGIYLWDSGALGDAIVVSLGRIFSGWLLGAAVGVPLGLLMAWHKSLRVFTTPYVQGLRYIPPIAFVGLFVVWFGTGETSKIALVFYTTVFVITLMTLSGAVALPGGLARAARCMGASETQVLMRVVVPQCVPYIVTGMRMALGNAFIVIAAAEMLAAHSGLGYVIWSSRNLMLTDQIFVGLFVVGILGLSSDRTFWVLSRRVFPYYRIT
jgi:ABC-type nitrate/sulfonate/bicarbonate transport system permease component